MFPPAMGMMIPASDPTKEYRSRLAREIEQYEKLGAALATILYQWCPPEQVDIVCRTLAEVLIGDRHEIIRRIDLGPIPAQYAPGQSPEDQLQRAEEKREALLKQLAAMEELKGHANEMQNAFLEATSFPMVRQQIQDVESQIDYLLQMQGSVVQPSGSDAPQAPDADQ